MALTDYTTYDEVRAVLGVAEDELENETLALPIYATVLEEDLGDLAPTLLTNYTVIKALDPAQISPDQARFLRLVAVWAAYDVAMQCLGSISMFAPKTIESDKDKEERIQDPYAALRGTLPAAAATMAARILRLFFILFPTAPAVVLVTPINVVNAGLATDPITG